MALKRSERAKIFMPFSALSGLDEAIRKREEFAQGRVELSQDRLCELNEAVGALCEGDCLHVIYYDGSEYKTAVSDFVRADTDNRLLVLKNMTLKLDDVYDIRKI